jgi:transposase InsO family protein
MSRRANCWDNAVAESFFKTLKVEHVYRQTYITRDRARIDLDFIHQSVFNRRSMQKSASWLRSLVYLKMGKVQYEPFKKLARLGPIPLGGAVITDAGRLPYKAIIHVAGISLLWVSSKKIASRFCQECNVFGQRPSL